MSSAPVDEALGIDLALVRVLGQLSAELPAQLSAVALSGLILPAPEASAYYYGLSSGVVRELQRNHNVTVFVFQDGPSELLIEASNTSVSTTYLQTITITILLAFRQVQHTPQTWFSKTSSTYDYAARRAARYNGAISNVMRTKIKGDAGIVDIEKLSDAFGEWDQNEDNPGLMTYAVSTWQIMQAINVPDGCDEP
jgi:hypothetical protein